MIDFLVACTVGYALAAKNPYVLGALSFFFLVKSGQSWAQQDTNWFVIWAVVALFFAICIPVQKRVKPGLFKRIFRGK